MVGMDALSFFQWFKENSPARVFVLLVCLIGTAYGFYYYQGQLSTTPFYLWVFVPDSPFFTLVYTLSLALYILGHRLNSLDVFAFIGLNKVGLWTLFVFILESDYYFSSSRWDFTLVLAALHVGMVLVALTLWVDMSIPSLRTALLLSGYFLLGDVMDYGFGLHPMVPEQRIFAIGASAFLLTGICSLATYHYLSKKRVKL